jgi:hypothetical protein
MPHLISNSSGRAEGQPAILLLVRRIEEGQRNGRLAALIERGKEGSLSPEEKAELDHFLDLEHILRMARARARQILSRGE